MSRTADELQLRGTDAGAPCVVVRRGPRSAYLGAAFRAAESTDLVRLADATGAKVEKLPESIGGLTVDLADPSGAVVRVVADSHELATLPGQPTQVFNFGHELPGRTARSARPVSPPGPATRPRGAADHEVPGDPELVPGAPRTHRQRLQVLRGAA